VPNHFRQPIFEEMASVNVPTLIIHGDEDKTVPIEITSEIAAKLIRTINLLFMKELSRFILH
jgi:pimeloyl-ACP methyl ester carboxylesterase